MEPEVKYLIRKGFPIVPLLTRINSIPRIDTYFFNIVLTFTPSFS